MKKISNNLLPVLIFSLFPFVLFAQQEEAPEDTKLSLGFFLGAGLTDVSSQQLAYPLSMTRLDALGKKQAVNARLGVHFIFHFNKEYGLETGLAYEKYGVNTSRAFDAENDTIVGGEQTKSSFSYEYFSLPILFRKNFAVNEQMQISLSTGLYFAYLQSASYGYSIVTYHTSPTGNVVEDIRSNQQSIKDYTRNRDLGLRLQLGLERKVSDTATLYLQAMYAKGLRGIESFKGNPGEVSNGKHRMLALSIGGYFRMK